LVVIAIIMVLAALLVPSLTKATRQAMAVHCASNMHQFYLGVFDWMKDHQRTEPMANYNSTGDYSWAEASRAVDLLMAGGYFDTPPAVFFCPSAGLNAAESFSLTIEPKFWLMPMTYTWIYKDQEHSNLRPGNTERDDGYHYALMYDSGMMLSSGWLTRLTRIGTLRGEHYNVLHLNGNVEVNFADTAGEANRILGLESYIAYRDPD
jgi:hypothetical protein